MRLGRKAGAFAFVSMEDGVEGYDQNVNCFTFWATRAREERYAMERSDEA